MIPSTNPSLKLHGLFCKSILMSLFLVFTLSILLTIPTKVHAQTDIFYTGDTIVIPAKKNRLLEIILPETYVNFQPDVPANQVSKFMNVKTFKDTNRIFLKFIRDDAPITIHLWGAESQRTYVLRIDFLTTEGVDDVYRIISDISSKTTTLTVTPPTPDKIKPSYIQRALKMGADSFHRKDYEKYTTYDNLKKEIMKTIPNFRFVLHRAHVGSEFAVYVIRVYNDLPVAQPFNLRSFYLPGLVAATISKKILAPRPRTESEFFAQGHVAELRLIFDLKTSSYLEELVGG